MGATVASWRVLISNTLANDGVHRARTLPVGLKGYYQRHWRAMRECSGDRTNFGTVYEPVLRFLATVREPVSIDYQ